jgi:hypothetical protein
MFVKKIMSSIGLGTDVFVEIRDDDGGESNYKENQFKSRKLRNRKHAQICVVILHKVYWCVSR